MNASRLRGQTATRCVISPLLILGLLVATAHGESPQPPVTVLTAAVHLDDASPESIAAMLDTVILQSVTGYGGFRLVDRQAIENVLRERELSAAGGNAPAELRPMLAAGVIVQPQVLTARSDATDAIVVMDAVSADNGNLLGSITLPLDRQGDNWQTTDAWQPALERLWRDTAAALDRQRAGILLVDAVALKSDDTRLQWRANQLADALHAAAGSVAGMTLLEPRHPLVTRDERLLRIMGLAGDDDHWSGIAAAATWRLETELVEQVNPNQPSDQAPVRLTLVLRSQTDELARAEWSAMAGELDTLFEQAVEFARDQAARLPSARDLTTEQSETFARQEAAGELAMATALEAIQYDASHPIELSRRVRVARHAMRAAYLDPTSEQSAWLAAKYLPAVYQQRGQYETVACKHHLLLEYGKYIDRFGDCVPEHHRIALNGIFTEGFRGAYLLEPGPSDPTRILRPPNERCYWLYRDCVRALAEIGYLENVDPRYPHRSNSDDVFAGWLRSKLIPHIPADHLAEEERWWREFWRTKAVKIADKAGPWELVEVAFAARAGDVDRVRRCFDELARRYPASDARIWQLSRNLDAVQLYLRAAGAADWETWKPTFDSTQPVAPARVTYRDLYWFERSLNMTPPGVWDLSELSKLPPACTLILPDELTRHGTTNWTIPYARVRALLSTGSELWLITPGILDVFGQDQPHRIWSIPLDDLRGVGTLAIEPVEVRWPEYPTPSGKSDATGPVITASHLSRTPDGPVIWLGTRHHSLARFQKEEGQWAGRWFTPRDGIPDGQISWIGSFAHDGRVHPIAASYLQISQRRADGSRTGSSQASIWSLDTTNSACTIHAQASGSRPTATVVHPDGQRVLMQLYGDSSLKLPPIDAACRFEEITHGSPRLISLNHNGQSRHFMATLVDDLNGPSANRHELWELDPDGLRTITSLTGPPTTHAITEASLRGDLHRELVRFKRPTPPVEEVAAITAEGPLIAMSTRYTPGQSRRGEGHRLVFYRPAAADHPDPDSADRWIGPLLSPDGKPIFGILGDGRGSLWITTSGGIHRVDVAALEALPGQTTAQWRETWNQRLAAADPAVRLRVHLAEGEFDAAWEVLNARKASAGMLDDTQRLHLRFDEALILSEIPDQRAAAADRLREIANDDTISPVAREYARRLAVHLYARLDRWQDVADLLPHLTRFEHDSLNHDWFARRIDEERAKAATQPAGDIE